MKLRTNVLTHLLRWNRRVLLLLGFAAGVILLVLWLSGKFSPKVPMDRETAESRPLAANAKTAEVREIRQPRFESAVGTIQAVHETSVGARLLARVVAINLKAGQAVRAGDVLVRLDDSGLQAKLQQAKSAVAAAEATRAQAASDVDKYAPLEKTGAISRQTYDKAVTALRTAEANLQGAEEMVKEVQATLSYATVRASTDAVVIDKKVNVGDTVTPGQVLVTLFDPQRMQLVASVRESLAHDLEEGQSIGVEIKKLNKLCSGTISEIVPEAQTASRTFQVKVTGPCPPGIYAGMFGRILIPLGEERILVVPRAAVRNVGQLELVEVVEKDRTSRRAIRTGRRIGEDVEVLSGLRAGERVVLPPASEAPREAAHG
jgi:RND family efflux transporter MFP subunit